MKRLELLVMALVTLAALCLCFTPAQGQTVAADIIPASTGYNMGHDSQRWNAYIQTFNLKGSFVWNGVTYTSPADFTLGTNGLASPGPIGSSTRNTGAFTTGRFGVTSTSWVTTYWPYVVAGATVGVFGDTGQNPAIIGVCHTLSGECVGVSGNSLGDNVATPHSGYGVYGEAGAAPGVLNSTYIGGEFDAFEQNDKDDSIDPYGWADTGSNNTIAGNFACGAAQAGVFGCSAAINITPNGSAFRAGINMLNGAIWGDNVGLVNAIRLAQNHCITIYSAAKTVGVRICSTSAGVLSIGSKFSVTGSTGALSADNGLFTSDGSGNITSAGFSASTTSDAHMLFWGNQTGALPTLMSLNGDSVEKFNFSKAGALTIPALKSTSGTRFVCVDTTGKLVSQTTACSGT